MSHTRIAAASLFSAAAAFLALAPAQAAAPGAVTLRYKYAPGQVLHYKMIESMQGATMGMPMTSRTSMVMTETVKSVDPRTGNATLLVQTSKPAMTMSMNGRPMQQGMPTLPEMTMTEVVSPLGKPVSISMNGGAAAGIGSAAYESGQQNYRLHSQTSIGFGQSGAFPDRPVAVGDVWRGVSTLGTMGAGQMYVKESLIGLSASGGHSVAKLATRFSTTASPKAGGIMNMTAASTGTGRELFDVNSGTLTSATTSMVITVKTKAPPAMAAYTGGKNAASFNTHMTMTMSMQLIGH